MKILVTGWNGLVGVSGVGDIFIPSAQFDGKGHWYEGRRVAKRVEDGVRGL